MRSAGISTHVVFAHGDDVVVHAFENEHLDVAEVAWDQQRHELSVAGRQRLRTRREAGEHEMDVPHLVPLRDDHLARREGLGGERQQPVQLLALGLVEANELFELHRKRVGHSDSDTPVGTLQASAGALGPRAAPTTLDEVLAGRPMATHANLGGRGAFVRHAAPVLPPVQQCGLCS
jgi:hypothetical protein